MVNLPVSKTFKYFHNLSSIHEVTHGIRTEKWKYAIMKGGVIHDS